MPELVHVAVAVIINHQNEVLISLRKKTVHQGGLWESPGGKVEAGELVFDALKREIKEELNLSINEAIPLKKIQHNYSDVTVLLDVWQVKSFEGNPVGAEGQQIKWLPINELNQKDFPVANRSIVMALKLPKRYMITGAIDSYNDFELKLEASLKKGISLVQLRCKKTSTENYKQLAAISMKLCEQYNATLLLNTTQEIFLDISRNAQCSVGLHISSQMLNTITLRPIADDFLFSVSCHDESEIQKAKQLSADIVLLSPVKETQSHPGVKGIGWEKFTEISATINTPVYALGGMAESDLKDAMLSGAQGVAAISSFWG